MSTFDKPKKTIYFYKMIYILDYMNNTMIPTYLDHIPEGTSTRTAAHYAQLYLSHNFEVMTIQQGRLHTTPNYIYPITLR